MQPLLVSNSSSSAPDHQLAVDADLAEFVLDDRDALAVLLREDAVQERGFSGAKEAREYRDRYA
jgi:hypothetical protein